MNELLLKSIQTYSAVRDAIVRTVEWSRASDPQYAAYSGLQMHYYSSRCQAMNILLRDGMLWDADILYRSALECATRFLFVSIAEQPERGRRIVEYMSLLSEVEDLHRTDKLRPAVRNSTDPSTIKLLSGASLTPEDEAELRRRWPASKRKELKQKWSFSEIARVLENIKTPTLNLTSYGSLLHSYSISSHLIHADQTAMTLVYDRATRGDEERELLESAHFSRLAIEQTSLLFICWRAMRHALPNLPKDPEEGHLAERLVALNEVGDVHHKAFANSQIELYAQVDQSRARQSDT